MQSPEIPMTENSQSQTSTALKALYHVTDMSSTENSQHLLVNALLQNGLFTRKNFPAAANGIEGIQIALQQFDLTIVPRRTALPCWSDASACSAYVCQLGGEYFAVRKFGQHWINLNHAMLRPAQLQSKTFGLCLEQIEEAGYEIFVVVGSLPVCSADRNPLFQTEWDWGLIGGLYPRRTAEDEDYDSDDEYNDQLEDLLRNMNSGGFQLEAQDSMDGKTEEET